MKKYAIFCDTDDKFEYIIADTAPTTCPINGAHTVDIDKVYCVNDNVLVNDGSTVDAAISLADYKQLRYNEIDGKTVALIAAGFVFDSATFSLSSPAQSNWHALKNQTAEFTFPKDITTINNDTYSLAEADVIPLWQAGKGVLDGHITSGRSLKKSVFDAVDKAAVDAVVDAR